MLFSPHVTHVSVELPLSPGLEDALKAEGLTLPPPLLTAHPGRKEKFLAGRYCALMALKKAGASSIGSLGIGTDGSPCWPQGWVGSITHHDKMAGAAVAPSEKLQGLGLDYELEMSERTFENVASRILFGKELNSARPSSWTEREWTTFVFSAKESIYKCLRPLCGQFFGFEAAELELLPQPGHFHFRLTENIGAGFNAGFEGQGRFVKNGGQFSTSVEFPTGNP